MTITDEAMEITRKEIRGKDLTIRQLIPVALKMTDRVIAKRKRVRKIKRLYYYFVNIKFKRNMKKLLLLLPIIAIAFSFTPPTKLPPPVNKYFTLSQVKEMKEFVTVEGKRLRETGWKYSDVNISIQGDKYYVVMSGSKLPPAPHSFCSATAWGGPYASCPSAMDESIRTLMLNYTNQGYNCVCRAGRNEVITDGGDWVGYQWCETVTAKVSALCDCIPN